MVNKPVGPPSGPPVPTDGDWLRGSLPGLSVCPVTAANRNKLVSAAKSALLASLIAFLLRNEFKFCGRATVLLEVASAARPLARPSQTCRGALAATRRSFECWARAPQLQAHHLCV